MPDFSATCGAIFDCETIAEAVGGFAADHLILPPGNASREEEFDGRAVVTEEQCVEVVGNPLLAMTSLGQALLAGPTAY